MISIYSILYTMVLFSELSSHFVTVAIPAAKVDDISMEQDGLFLDDEPTVTDLAAVPSTYRQNLMLDTNMKNEDGSPQVIIFSDMRLKGHSIRGLNPAFTRSFPLLTQRSSSYTLPEKNFKIDRRDTDLDMLRCMIGRVYRPCWEV